MPEFEIFPEPSAEERTLISAALRRYFGDLHPNDDRRRPATSRWRQAARPGVSGLEGGPRIPLCWQTANRFVLGER